MPFSELAVRAAVPAVFAVSAVYCAVSYLLARGRQRRGVPVPGVYPGSREQAGDLNLAWWRSLPAVVQAAHDQAVLDAAEAAENVANRTAPLYRS